MRPYRGEPLTSEEAVVEIPKPTEADVEFFRSVVPDEPGVEVRPMFGNLGAFVNGNMFSGLFGSAVGVKVNDADRAELEQVEGTGPYGPAERPMSGWSTLPVAWRGEPGQVTAWLGRAYTHVATLPPKKPKAPKKSR
jgi:TfoX/Sxy family transcriptional regulator of competence genes